MSQTVGMGDGAAWGLGGDVGEIAGHKTFAKGGGDMGYHAYLIGTPDGKFIVTALVNTEDGNVKSPSLAALRYIIQQNESK